MFKEKVRRTFNLFGLEATKVPSATLEMGMA